jgi:hypothetical protein
VLVLLQVPSAAAAADSSTASRRTKPHSAAGCFLGQTYLLLQEAIAGRHNILALD